MGKECSIIVMGRNHRTMTYEEEAELLAQFIHEADSEHIIDVSVIKALTMKKLAMKLSMDNILCAAQLE